MFRPGSSTRGLDHVLFWFAGGPSVGFEIARSIGKYTALNHSFYGALGFAPPA